MHPKLILGVDSFGLERFAGLGQCVEGKRVLLVEDSIVRGTTLRTLVDRVRRMGRPREIHVRVGCPPIISPCFYGIDMSTIGELFAPEYLEAGPLTPEAEARMAETVGADSLRYLPVEAVARAIGLPSEKLCRACITGEYPTVCGRRMAEVARQNHKHGVAGRTYETAAPS